MVKVSKSMYALNGPVEIKQAETDDMMISIFLNKKLANGYTPSSLCRYENEPLCPTVLSDRFNIFKDFFSQSDMPFTCPHEPGVYNITNYRPNAERFPPFVPGREWRLDLLFIKNYITVAGCQLFVTLIN
ncbi:uncharacterized protein LOC123290830 [Chrysoperla carnea]|uniref:uncharacterized protein LOC123290830 n=1 Tax=Chrysoperla carnea TaxID=189513 RepID=UPI001D0686FB|nr:uncharacterized protein LOC123290830 [Chrysoperla carnea]